MQSIIDSKLLERLRVGPLAPYLDVYLTRIEQDGFLPSSVPCQAYAIARLSRWLEQKHCRLEDLDEPRVRKFLGRDPGVVHYPEPATIRRLVSILREIGVLKDETPAALTSVQRYVAEYRRYLVQQRGLSESSLPNYISFVEQFLSGRFTENELRLAELCASDVTTLVKAQAAKLSRVRAKLLVTALVPSCVTSCSKGRSRSLWPIVFRQWRLGHFLKYRNPCQPAQCKEFLSAKTERLHSGAGTTQS